MIVKIKVSFVGFKKTLVNYFYLVMFILNNNMLWFTENFSYKYYKDFLNNIMQVITIMHAFRSTLGYFSVSWVDLPSFDGYNSQVRDWTDNDIFSIHTNDIRPYLVCLTNDESPKTMYKLPSTTINNNIVQREACSEIKEIILLRYLTV